MCYFTGKWEGTYRKRIPKAKQLFLFSFLQPVVRAKHSGSLLQGGEVKLWCKIWLINEDNARAGFSKLFRCICALKNIKILWLIWHGEHLFIHMFYKLKSQLPLKSALMWEKDGNIFYKGKAYFYQILFYLMKKLSSKFQQRCTSISLSPNTFPNCSEY